MTEKKFWDKKRVLLTGHTGFKGGWLSAWLLELGAAVTGLALPPNTEPSFFKLCGLETKMKSFLGNIGDPGFVNAAVHETNPEIVFHLAAQPIVRYSYAEPVKTFLTNVMGTVHLLEAVRNNPAVRVVVVVTSDKCYENKEWVWGYRENEPMGGDDPYSASKGCAELVTRAYRMSFFQEDSGAAVASARAGNVIGGGDWGEDRLVPDAIRAFYENKPFVVRNPLSVRPWQHVLEPLAGYLRLAEKLRQAPKAFAGAWNFGPKEDDSVTVGALADKIAEAWGGAKWETSGNGKEPKEMRFLKLDAGKARHELDWRPVLTLDEAVDMTAAWYKKAMTSKPGEMHSFTIAQIEEYCRKAAEAKNRCLSAP